MPVYLRIYVATILPSVSFAILCILTSIHKTGLELIAVELFIYWALYMIIIGAPLQTTKYISALEICLVKSNRL